MRGEEGRGGEQGRKQRFKETSSEEASERGGRGGREREMSACVHSNARPHASHLDEAHFMHTVAPYAAQNHHVSLTAQEDAR